MSTSDRWSRSTAPLCERLAGQLRSEGVAHPEVAAVALAVRGRRRLDRRRWAELIGLAEHEVAEVESGQVGWRDIPTALRRPMTSLSATLRLAGKHWLPNGAAR